MESPFEGGVSEKWNGCGATRSREFRVWGSAGNQGAGGGPECNSLTSFLGTPKAWKDEEGSEGERC